MRNNQGKLDEIERFVEPIGIRLFGPGGGDFRLLRDFIPTGANRSLVIDAARTLPGRDVAVDFASVEADLFRHLAAPPAQSGEHAAGADGVINFLPYRDLLARPDLLFDGIEGEHHPALRELVSTEPRLVAAALARTHAHAWLELVGLPDLASEFDPLALDPEVARTRRGLAAIFRALPDAGRERLVRYLSRVHCLLSIEYRDQIRRLVAAVS
jgi:hypothetical protein